MAKAQSPAARRLLATSPASQHAGGGRHIRGPGTATSDSIDAKLSDGEFVLPADTVRKVGVKSLRDLVGMTHTPSGKPAHPAQFADGGLVGANDELDTWARQQEQQRAVRSQASRAQAQATMDEAARATASAAASAPPRAAASVGDGPSQIPAGGPKAPAPDGSQDRVANTELGRNVGNALAALPGVAGAVPAIVKTGGMISTGLGAASRLLNAGVSVAASPSISASAATPASPALPSADAGAGRGVISPPAVDPGAATPAAPERSPVGDSAQLGQRTTSDVTRDGNSYSGTNVAGDITINGQAPRNGGRVSARNMAAADNLAAGQRSPVGMTVEEAQRQGLVGERVGYDPAYDQRLNAAGQAPGARARLMGTGAESAAEAVPQVQAPTIRHSGNDWHARNDLRNLSVAARSITNQPGFSRGGRAYVPPDVAAYQAAVQADATLRQAQPGMDQATMRENADLQRTGVQEQGATTRARLQETGRNDRFGLEQGLARDRFGLEQTAAGYTNRSAQRIEQAQQDLEAAGNDPTKLSTARQRLLGLQGKTDDARWKGIALQGATDAMGNKTESVLAAVNERTGEIRQDRGGRAAAPAPLPPRDQLVAGQTYQTTRGQAVWDGSKFNAK